MVDLTVGGGFVIGLLAFVLGEILSWVWNRIVPPPEAARYQVGARAVFMLGLLSFALGGFLVAIMLEKWTDYRFPLGLAGTLALAATGVSFDLLKERIGDSRNGTSSSR